jgi:hypothetical protein
LAVKDIIYENFSEVQALQIDLNNSSTIEKKILIDLGVSLAANHV